MTVHVEPDRDVGMQGQYAGIVTRTAAFGIDLLVATALFAIGGRVVEFVLSSVSGRGVSLSDAPVVSAIALGAWLLFYLSYPIAVSGRTPGMALVGLQVVTKDGRAVAGTRAVVRTIVLPLSLILLAIGILMILINRNRRGLHDLIAGTAVVYSWNARAARLRFLAKSSSAHGGSPSAAISGDQPD
jgi:uncharacterized RDD family membrane protein YckC